MPFLKVLYYDTPFVVLPMLSSGDFIARDLDGLEVYSSRCTVRSYSSFLLLVYVNCISRFRRHYKNAKLV